MTQPGKQRCQKSTQCLITHFYGSKHNEQHADINHIMWGNKSSILVCTSIKLGNKIIYWKSARESKGLDVISPLVFSLVGFTVISDKNKSVVLDLNMEISALK